VRIKDYSIAVALSVVGMFSVPQAAGARSAPGGNGTHWQTNSDCPFDYLSFFDDGTVRIAVVDEDSGDETYSKGTWALSGAKLSIKFPDDPYGGVVGTFDGPRLQMNYNWKDDDNRIHVDSCTATRSGG
jgi:hypothetical protein